VTESLLFHPPHRKGLIFQIIMILALLAMGILGLWQAAQAQIGLSFLLYLIPILLALFFVPLITYRTYALWRASYLLERDGIYLRWGLREEIIPMDAVTWMRLSHELDISIPRPWLSWPGAVLGVRKLPDGTRVEYLAAKASQMILIATGDNIYAISPANEAEFMLAYQRYAELGSLTPLAPHSSYPANLLRRVWAAKPARYLLLAGFLVAILLLVLVSLNVPSNLTITLGFNPDGTPSEPVPSVFLLLLPLLNGIFYFTNVLVGLYLFRTPDRQILAYLLWGSGLFTGLLFTAAAILILRAS
jgi:hypothetical protein